MLDRKMSSGATHAGHHLIGDQQNTMPAADLRHTLKIAGWRHDSAKRRPADRFDDECRYFAVYSLNCPLQLRGVLLPAVTAAIGAIKRATVTIRKCDMLELLHHWKIDFTPPLGLTNLHLVLPC